MKRALLLIRMASWAVPVPYRSDWRREWEAEIHNALRVMEARGESTAFIGARLIDFARGAFRDAAWHGRDLWNRELVTASLSHFSQSAGFCLAALAALIPLIGILSGFFPATRNVVLPLAYRDAARVATIVESGSIATRYGIAQSSVRLLRQNSRTVEDFATYTWGSALNGGLLTARVSDNFFSVLGVPAPDLKNCLDCAVLSHDFWRQRFGGKTFGGDDTISLAGQTYRVAGVLDKRFWFLSPRVAAWVVAPPSKPTDRSGVVLRMQPDVNKSYAEEELGSILRLQGVNPWESVLEISPVVKRVRSVFGSFALALSMAIVTTIVALRLRPARPQKGAFLRAGFFLLKTALALTAVLLCGLEFTRASSITMLGGTDAWTEPLSSWLFLMGSMGVLFWSVYDQRRRCRICLRRLGLATHVGCPGCLLLDWAGTELVCIQGHGMLHVPEMVACWQEPHKWTSLDESWQELF